MGVRTNRHARAQVHTQGTHTHRHACGHCTRRHRDTKKPHQPRQVGRSRARRAGPHPCRRAPPSRSPTPPTLTLTPRASDPSPQVTAHRGQHSHMQPVNGPRAATRPWLGQRHILSGIEPTQVGPKSPGRAHQTPRSQRWPHRPPPARPPPVHPHRRLVGGAAEGLRGMCGRLPSTAQSSHME